MGWEVEDEVVEERGVREADRSHRMIVGVEGEGLSVRGTGKGCSLRVEGNRSWKIDELLINNKFSNSYLECVFVS